MAKDRIFELSDIVRETCFALHRWLRHGHLEKVYEMGLVHRLRARRLNVEAQFPLNVHDEDGTVLGSYFADLYVEQCLLVEIKACKGIADEHIAQLLGYLRTCNVEHGILVNFGSPKLQIKKYALSRI